MAKQVNEIERKLDTVILLLRYVVVLELWNSRLTQEILINTFKLLRLESQ